METRSPQPGKMLSRHADEDRPMRASVDDLVAVTLELEAPERHLVKFLLTC